MRIYVTDWAARTPIGLTARASALAYRSPRLCPRSTPFRDRHGEFHAAATCAGLPPTLTGCERMKALLAMVLRDLRPPCAASRELASGELAPLLIAGPLAGRADDDAKFGEELLHGAATKASLPILGARSQVVRDGHAGFARVLQLATSMLAEPGGPADVLVAGVDSYFHQGVLAALEAERRVHGLHEEDGFIPAEGAGVLRLSRVPPKSGRPVSFVSCRFGRNPAGPAIAPLAPVMNQIMQELFFFGARVAGWAVCDVNGEVERVMDWEQVANRALHGMPTARLSEGLGDCGAGSGGIFAAMVCSLWEFDAGHDARAIIALHSDNGARGAFILQSEAA